jgi:poly(3-hydroxyalkanoate) synthetase
VELWRYHSDRRVWRPPVFIIYSLVSHSYILDLSPDNTFVGRLLNAGLDVFLIDWGVPDETDAGNTFETYVDYYLPQAIKALLAEAGSDGLTVLGYCSGGDLALFLTARHPELPIRNLITAGTPQQRLAFPADLGVDVQSVDPYLLVSRLRQHRGHRGVRHFHRGGRAGEICSHNSG